MHARCSFVTLFFSLLPPSFDRRGLQSPFTLDQECAINVRNCHQHASALVHRRSVYLSHLFQLNVALAKSHALAPVTTNTVLQQTGRGSWHSLEDMMTTM